MDKCKKCLHKDVCLTKDCFIYQYKPDYQTLESRLEQYREALETIKTYSSGPIITIGEPDEEEGFPEGSVYGYNSAIEQITEEVINPLLGISKPREANHENPPSNS